MVRDKDFPFHQLLNKTKFIANFVCIVTPLKRISKIKSFRELATEPKTNMYVTLRKSTIFTIFPQLLNLLFKFY